MNRPKPGDICPFLKCDAGHDFVVRRRKSTGTLFLGCAEYPNCTVTADLHRAKRTVLDRLATSNTLHEADYAHRLLDIDLWFYGLTDDELFCRVITQVTAVLGRYVPVDNETSSMEIDEDGLVSLDSEELR